MSVANFYSEGRGEWCLSYNVGKMLMFFGLVFFFFFSSRRRHTRCREVSWARRCVQETGINAEYMGHAPLNTGIDSIPPLNAPNAKTGNPVERGLGLHRISKPKHTPTLNPQINAYNPASSQSINAVNTTRNALTGRITIKQSGTNSAFPSQPLAAKSPAELPASQIQPDMTKVDMPALSKRLPAATEEMNTRNNPVKNNALLYFKISKNFI
eukprot:TRINITY_DN4460_c0_g2_i4.p7 TRINITY_DN4460_c0_g2~~TRINITY_DN4460_c0_g2_i4.p7  ORF type:complete len:212 (+),score=58.39 TRINITY_DN4460_c0_g2_i4:20-655(+)